MLSSSRPLTDKRRVSIHGEGRCIARYRPSSPGSAMNGEGFPMATAASSTNHLEISSR